MFMLIVALPWMLFALDFALLKLDRVGSVKLVRSEWSKMEFVVVLSWMAWIRSGWSIRCYISWILHGYEFLVVVFSLPRLATIDLSIFRWIVFFPTIESSYSILIWVVSLFSLCLCLNRLKIWRWMLVKCIDSYLQLFICTFVVLGNGPHGLFFICLVSLGKFFTRSSKFRSWSVTV